jgi:hypothetical protein
MQQPNIVTNYVLLAIIRRKANTTEETLYMYDKHRYVLVRAINGTHVYSVIQMQMIPCKVFYIPVVREYGSHCGHILVQQECVM